VRRLFALLLAAAFGIAPAISRGQIPAAKDVVASSAYTSFDPVARGHEFQIAVVLKIRDGYHINARKPTLDYLIPTDLKVDLPPGFKASEVSYPDGTLKSFSFSKTEKLNVYTGTVILRLRVTALPDAPFGAQHIPLKLRYQACSESVCLPPVKQDVDTAFAVATTGKTAHEEFFKQK
jgi:DsbC/DsbD-like thiol-disulfide interchange protein